MYYQVIVKIHDDTAKFWNGIVGNAMYNVHCQQLHEHALVFPSELDMISCMQCVPNDIFNVMLGLWTMKKLWKT